MIPLQESGAQVMCAIRDDYAVYGEGSIAPSTPAPIDAQAAYQVALDDLRSHRNRWRAPGPQVGLAAR